ncbi:MAG: hypothetical protein DRG37_02810 [Deltaproteobacteria bacterium]|nr:MAG: hypothetical protein DRG37_02810 [Deltaproteobacteria bacterium]
MKTYRRHYYNVFSSFYDRFVSLHSADKEGRLRKLLSNASPLEKGDVALDLCTGTGAMLHYLCNKVGPKGMVIGSDFSHGMLKEGLKKTRSLENVLLVESDAAYLPFKSHIFDAVTCAYAFYELQGDAQDKMLKEVIRVLKPGHPFLVMEHDLPESMLIRILLYIRLLSMGLRRAIDILKYEKDILERYFVKVEKISLPKGRSKILVCWTDLAYSKQARTNK